MKLSFARTLVPAALVLGAAAAFTTEASAQDTRAKGPPPAAVSACASKAEGAACTVEHGGAHAGTFTGTCSTGHISSTLACRPAPPRPRS
jgi:hypothetical protein